MTEARPRGGRREGAGRPPLMPGDKTEQLSVRLYGSQVRWLHEMGGGNVNALLRDIVQLAMDLSQSEE